jgi:hypothetical protein
MSSKEVAIAIAAAVLVVVSDDQKRRKMRRHMCWVNRYLQRRNVSLGVLEEVGLAEGALFRNITRMSLADFELLLHMVVWS